MNPAYPTLPQTNQNTSPNNVNNIVRPTGITELDQMLQGGFPSDSTILLAGGSGTGKTTLTYQWLVAGYEKYNEPGLFISATEPLNKAIRNLNKYSFGKNFNMTKNTIIFEDLRTITGNLNLDEKELNMESFDKIIEAISTLIHESGAKRVVIDSITAIAYQLQHQDSIRRFIYHLDALVAMSGVNIIMTSEVSGDGYSVFGVEEFISDGIIKLSRTRNNGELIRQLEIAKMRGINYNSHPASYKISEDGIMIYPRLFKKLKYKASNNRITSGITGIDTMTSGGFFEGSSILATGSSGTGKSIFGLQFLVSNLKTNIKGVLVSFEESKEQIYRNAMAFGWNLKEYEESGLLTIVTGYPEERYLEEHIQTITKTIEQTNAQVFVLDSLSSLGNVFSKSILRDLVSRLNAFLKSKSVTTIYTNATQTLMGATQITDSHLSTITDQIIMLRYVEVQAKLHHAVLILKMRGSKHDKSLKEIVFTPQGLSIASDFSGLEGVLMGSTKRVAESTEEKLQALFLEILGPMGKTIFNNEKQKGLELKNIQKMINNLEKEGVLPKKSKDEFLKKTHTILNNNKLS